jgi:hypothetical protein
MVEHSRNVLDKEGSGSEFLDSPEENSPESVALVAKESGCGEVVELSAADAGERLTGRPAR